MNAGVPAGGVALLAAREAAFAVTPALGALVHALEAMGAAELRGLQDGTEVSDEERRAWRAELGQRMLLAAQRLRTLNEKIANLILALGA